MVTIEKDLPPWMYKIAGSVIEYSGIMFGAVSSMNINQEGPHYLGMAWGFGAYAVGKILSYASDRGPTNQEIQTEKQKRKRKDSGIEKLIT
jgi:hypothetical protein